MVNYLFVTSKTLISGFFNLLIIFISSPIVIELIYPKMTPLNNFSKIIEEELVYLSFLGSSFI